MVIRRFLFALFSRLKECFIFAKYYCTTDLFIVNNRAFKAADDDAGKLQPVFLKRLYLLHICIFSFFLFTASLSTI